MKKNVLIWVIWVVVTFLIAVVATVVAAFFIGYWSILAGGLFFLLINAWAFYAGMIEVSENHVALLEIFSKYAGDRSKPQEEDEGVIRPGLHLFFPFFGIFRMHKNTEFFLGEDKLRLFANPLNLTDFHCGLSSGVEAYINYEIKDARCAAYAYRDFFGIITEKTENSLRTAFGKIDFEDANKNRGGFTLDSVFSPDEREKIEKPGILIISLAVSDFILSEEDIETREKVFKAKNDLKMAEFDKKTKIVKAEATAQETEIIAGADAKKIVTIAGADAKKIVTIADAEGEGIKRIKDLSGLNNKDIISLEAVKAIKPTDKLIIGNGAASLGAEFAYGSSVVKSKE